MYNTIQLIYEILEDLESYI